MSTLCLLHGAWHDGSCWHEVAGELRARGHQVVAPDLPLDDPHAGYAARLAPAVELLSGVDGAVVIVGHSLGSDYAAVLATKIAEPSVVHLCPRLGGLTPPPDAPRSEAPRPPVARAGREWRDDLGSAGRRRPGCTDASTPRSPALSPRACGRWPRWRQRRLAAFYAGILRPGDLAFDIGAHVGNRTRAMLAAGARVVALEPQAAFHAFLARDLPPGATLLRLAAGPAPGEAELAVSRLHPTVSSLAADFPARMRADPGFSAVRWDSRERVEVTTLDALIAAHGLPRLIKIDVEGFEAEVVAGLSQPVPWVAFEYLPAALAPAEAAIARLAALARYRFNLVAGEAHRLLPARLARRHRHPPGARCGGAIGPLGRRLRPARRRRRCLRRAPPAGPASWRRWCSCTSCSSSRTTPTRRPGAPSASSLSSCR